MLFKKEYQYHVSYFGGGRFGSCVATSDKKINEKNFNYLAQSINEEVRKNVVLISITRLLGGGT